VLAEFGGDGVSHGVAEGWQDAPGALEQVDLEVVCGQRLGRLDADVAAPYDGRRVRRLPVGVRREDRGVDVVPAHGVGVGVVRRREERPQGRRRVHVVERERALEVRPLDGRRERPGAGGNQQVPVGLLERPSGPSTVTVPAAGSRPVTSWRRRRSIPRSATSSGVSDTRSVSRGTSPFT
jgi:hypothetical protein